MSQGNIPQSQTNENLISQYEEAKNIKGYVYLRYQNVVKHELVTPDYKIHYISDYPDLLARKDKIYANGVTEIYK